MELKIINHNRNNNKEIIIVKIGNKIVKLPNNTIKILKNKSNYIYCHSAIVH